MCVLKTYMWSYSKLLALSQLGGFKNWNNELLGENDFLYDFFSLFSLEMFVRVLVYLVQNCNKYRNEVLWKNIW
jgi:hypothetical protein